jgi:hypothetical protein
MLARVSLSPCLTLSIRLHLTAARHLRTLANLIATNREVRKILSDFSVIGRDILAGAASQVVHTVRPAQEAISDVDRPAPSDRFETVGGKQVGLDETPVAEIQVPSTSGAVRHHPHTGVEIERGGQVLDASQAADEAQGRAQEIAVEVAEYVHIRCNFLVQITEPLAQGGR